MDAYQQFVVWFIAMPIFVYFTAYFFCYAMDQRQQTPHYTSERNYELERSCDRTSARNRQEQIRTINIPRDTTSRTQTRPRTAPTNRSTNRGKGRCRIEDVEIDDKTGEAKIIFGGNCR